MRCFLDVLSINRTIVKSFLCVNLQLIWQEFNSALFSKFYFNDDLTFSGLVLMCRFSFSIYLENTRVLSFIYHSISNPHVFSFYSVTIFERFL